MRSRATLRKQYEARIRSLEVLQGRLENETKECLASLPHIDRIYFRTKGIESFVEKALDPNNQPPYDCPLSEIEDQVAGRVIVFFLSDIQIVVDKLRATFTAVEQKHRSPARDEEFGYESHHLICLVPPHLQLERARNAPILNTFELQIRTIFMHAYSEPQHDLAYKSALDLPPQARRELAWIAASAWGADQAFARVNARRTESVNDNAAGASGRTRSPRR